MRTIVRCKSVWSLSDEDYKKCSRLNLGPNGSMRSVLRNITKRPEDFKFAYAVMLKDKDSGMLLSWALIWQRELQYSSRSHPVAYFYTRASHRSMGYGTRIANHIAKNVVNKYHVIPWDDRSTVFFKKIGMVGR